jgi:hypothetical protein
MMQEGRGANNYRIHKTAVQQVFVVLKHFHSRQILLNHVEHSARRISYGRHLHCRMRVDDAVVG